MKKTDKKISLWKIFSINAKIGGVTIGGGYAMVPVIRDEYVNKHKFISDDDFSALLVIAQSMPGPIAVNTSTLVGYKLRKIPGLLAAVAGAIFFPTLIIITIAVVLGKFYNVLQPFLKGMKAPLFAVIFVSVLKMWKTSIKSKEDIIVFAVALALLTVLNFSPFYLILIGILYGVLRTSFGRRVNGK